MLRMQLIIIGIAVVVVLLAAAGSTALILRPWEGPSHSEADGTGTKGVDDGQPRSAVRRSAGTLEQPNRVAVLVYVYVVGCRIRTQPRHSQHVACEGVDEARAHAGAHLAYREGVARGHVL